MTDFLNDIRLIVWNEKESGKLSEVPADLFRNGKENLEEIQTRIKGFANPLSEEAAELLDQYHSTSETLNTIIKLRLKKILKLAEAQIEERYYDKEEVKLMLPPERAMFNAVCQEIGVCRDTLMGGREAEKETVEAGLPPEKDTSFPFEEEVFFEDEAVPPLAPTAVEEKKPAAGENAVVLMKQEVPAFMGLDGRTYALGEGDIVTLPKGNADLLCERNIALNIRLIK
jgi:DNA replication factor GINS